MRAISIGKVLVANTKTTMYTVPTKYTGRWNLLHVTNGTSSGKKVDAWWYDASANLEIPVIFAYFISNETFTVGLIYIAYGAIWFYVNEKYII
jgi:hypothetical protein